VSRPAPTPAGPIPPREEWPLPDPQTETGEALTQLILIVFRLHGRLQEAAQAMAAQGGINAAWWQVIGGVLDEPRSVAEIARRMGMTRQGVQRVADLLVDRGLAAYRPNPAHRRAKLLAPTEAGYWAVRSISLAQHPWAEHIGHAVGAESLRAASDTLGRLVEVLETDAWDHNRRAPPDAARQQTPGEVRRSGSSGRTSRRTGRL
jgi:DNA-binding MarR family transcriptional regulator